jgi:hypothetical protein
MSSGQALVARAVGGRGAAKAGAVVSVMQHQLVGFWGSCSLSMPCAWCAEWQYCWWACLVRLLCTRRVARHSVRLAATSIESMLHSKDLGRTAANRLRFDEVPMVPPLALAAPKHQRLITDSVSPTPLTAAQQQQQRQQVQRRQRDQELRRQAQQLAAPTFAGVCDMLGVYCVAATPDAG